MEDHFPDATKEHEELQPTAFERALGLIREQNEKAERYRNALFRIRWHADTINDAVKIAAKAMDYD
jgi:hypothetical protein